MKYNGPCLGCEDRQLKCHSNCDKYLEFKNYRNEIREKIQEENKLIASCKVCEKHAGKSIASQQRYKAHNKFRRFCEEDI